MINIKAIQWKHPDAQFRASGELVYANIVWTNDVTLTEAEVTQAETEYDDYLLNGKPLEDSKQLKIEQLRQQQIDRAIQAQINAVNVATSQAEVDAVTLP